MLSAEFRILTCCYSYQIMSFEHVTCSIKGPPYMADLLILIEHGHVSCSINSIMPPLLHVHVYSGPSCIW